MDGGARWPVGGPVFDVVWRSVVDVAWCGMAWCGMAWRGVVWCGVVWCGVVWCGAATDRPTD